ncbi:ABC-transporter-regulating transcription factor-like protein [Abortiporus biennis]
MSSAEEDEQVATQSLKKRRVQRACDICRRKKVRCDGGQMPGHRCSNCTTYNYECTYVEAAKKRGPPKGYVESLENRLQKMESLLHKLCPDADFSSELGAAIDKDGYYTEKNASPAMPPPAPNPDADNLEPSDDEITSQRTLASSLKQMQINPSHLRFFGKSSSVMFIQTAIEAKHEYAGLDASESGKSADGTSKRKLVMAQKRPQFWGIHPWVNQALQVEKPLQTFPPDDLLASLTDLYFMHVNCYMPLLHRATFEKHIQEGLHHRDEGFGATVLLVCAVGSRFTDDTRVFLEGADSTHSAGWEWFRQIQLVRKSLLAPPRLYDLQACALTAFFLQGTSAPQACWTVIGVGIRLAQDVGAHRRKVYNTESTVEEELWKRAFWVLVSIDRSMSMTLGRPCAIQDEDFDLELPTECDDEFWEITGETVKFKQPANQPSKITFFNCLLRLNQILAFALRTIYSINKSKALLGFVGPQWEQHIVAELDSALNKWIDSVPDHLRWDPNRENILFLNQSAYLYAHYYQLQIAVHRPFIPSPRKPSPLSFPSLAICTNAARSCTHVLDVPYKRAGSVLFANQMALFTSGIVLLLNIWGGKRSGLSTDPNKEMADVHKCMKMLKILEPRWHTAGRLWDVLYELASVGDLPLPQASPAPSHKRERDSDTPQSSAASNSATSPPVSTSPSLPSESQSPKEGVRNIAGSRRVSRDTHAQHHQFQSQHQPMPQPPLRQQSQPQPQPNLQVPISPQVQPSQQQASTSYPTVQSIACPSTSSMPTNTASGNFSLPFYTEELGRIPLHPGYPPECSSSGWYNQQQQQQPSTPCMTSPPTQTPGAGPSSVTATGLAATGADPRMDPSMVQMFTMPPTLYDQVMSMSSGTVGADATEYMGPEMTGITMDTLGTTNPTAPADVQMNSYPDSDTLAMWSNAPAGFEWDDWGTYITNVSGMGDPNRPPVV